ncbi:hypothetical protein DFJ73DRAFT_863611, partial [Zopfochytrium polystomum]
GKALIEIDLFFFLFFFSVRPGMQVLVPSTTPLGSTPHQNYVFVMCSTTIKCVRTKENKTSFPHKHVHERACS